MNEVAIDVAGFKMASLKSLYFFFFAFMILWSCYIRRAVAMIKSVVFTRSEWLPHSFCLSYEPSGQMLTLSGQRMLVTALVLLITIATTSNAKTVVFYPPPSTSYIIYHTNVAAALAELGHEVWLCVPHYLVPKDLVKEKSVNIIVYGEHMGNLETRVFGASRMIDNFWDEVYSHELITFYYFAREYTRIAHEILSDKSFVDRVRNLKPDLLVLESIPFNVNMIVLPYMLDIPYALIGTFHDVVLSKVPFSPGTTPFPSQDWSDRMAFFERVKSTVIYIMRINFDLFHDSSLVSRFAPHKPYKSINDLAANSEVIIAEVDHILDYPRTALPNTKLIGGSSASPAKPLTGEFKKFVEGSKNGIVVVSFGGTVINVPPHITSKLVSAFKQLNLRVVWRVNITSPDPNQILASKWIPQNDLIGHDKTKLFVSHCGKNGQYEGLYHAVPMLCLPIFGDQFYNAERVRIKQLGMSADMRKVSADELASLMKQIVYDSKYTESMKKASSLYRELYKLPMKEAAYWFDHVMKYGGEYMRSPGQQMPWYQLCALDVIAFLLALITLASLSIYVLIRQLYKYYKGNGDRIKAKKE